MNTFKVSVIISVYNAEKFIRKAVDSALQLDEVEEIIMVEDASTDNTLAVCQQIVKENKNIKLFQHPGEVNKGVSASKNLGIKKASCDIIAFLDADDYFLPNRFKAEKKIFPNHPEADGVYGALGFHYYSAEFREKYAKKIFHTDLTTMTEKIPPEQLKYVLVRMCRDDKGYFSIVALTVKKSLIEKVGYIDENVDFHQDTHFLIKIAIYGTLLPGIIDKPVGMRGVHGANRITSSGQNAHSRYLLYTAMEEWLQSDVKGEEEIKRFISKDRMVYQLLSSQKNRLVKTINLIRLLFKEPFVFYIEFSFNILMNGLYGGRAGKIFIRLRRSALNIIFKKQAQKWDLIIYDHYCN